MIGQINGLDLLIFSVIKTKNGVFTGRSLIRLECNYSPLSCSLISLISLSFVFSLFLSLSFCCSFISLSFALSFLLSRSLLSLSLSELCMKFQAREGVLRCCWVRNISLSLVFFFSHSLVFFPPAPPSLARAPLFPRARRFHLILCHCVLSSAQPQNETLTPQCSYSPHVPSPSPSLLPSRAPFEEGES